MTKTPAPTPSSSSASGAPPSGLWLQARQVLRVRKVWLVPIVMVTIVLSVLSALYVGSFVNPTGHLHDLPIRIVNDDEGATVHGRRVDIGRSVATALGGSSAVTSRLELQPSTLAQANDAMDRGDAYATIVIPKTFTKSVLLATGRDTGAAGVPADAALTVESNRRLGSMGVSMASTVIDAAVQEISPKVGAQVSTMATPAATNDPVLAGRLADPLTIVTTTYRPLPDHSALGMSAFYIALLSIMAGFLGGTLINSTVDGALGYGVSDMGPRRKQRKPLPINRRQTFLTKWAIAVVAAPIFTGAVLLVGVGVLGMDAPHLLELWGLCALSTLMISTGMLALLATFGSLGQIIGTIVLIYLSLASSGGTVPVQALPHVLQVVGNVEPLRQVMTGTRAIMYFDARGDAGLTQAVAMITVLLAFWGSVGLFVTRLYDRKGLHRISPEVIAFVDRVVDARADELRAAKAAPADPAPAPVA